MVFVWGRGWGPRRRRGHGPPGPGFGGYRGYGPPGYGPPGYGYGYRRGPSRRPGALSGRTRSRTLGS